MARLRKITLLTLALFMGSNLTAEALMVEAPAESPQRVLEASQMDEARILRRELRAVHKLLTDPYREFIGKPIFTQEFMEAIAQCETGQDPAHIGRASAGYGEGATFRGAFGNWTLPNGSGTFEYYGGRELAGTWWADQATYDQQKVIYIRKSLYGYTTPEGKFIPPRGLSRNNCLVYAGEPTYETYWGN